MFGQICRPRSECTIPMYCKISPLPTPQLWHPPSCSITLCGLSSLAVPSDGMQSCMPFIMDGKVLEIFAKLVEHHRQTADKLLKICAPLWWALIIRQNVQTLSDTKMGSPARLRAGQFSWCGQGVPLSVPLVQPYGSTTDNHKILLQFNLHKLYNLWKIICNWKNFHWKILLYII